MSIPGIVFLSYFASLTPFFSLGRNSHIDNTHTCHFAHVTGSVIGSMGESFVTALNFGLCCDDPGKSLENPGNMREETICGSKDWKVTGLLCFCNAKNLFLICS